MRSCSATRNQVGRSFHSGRSIGDGDAGRRDRPLNGRQHGEFLRRGILREGGGEGCLGQIDQPMIVGRELGRLRMRLGAVEHIRDRFALVRSERGDVDQRLHLLVARRPDDGSGIGVADENDRPCHPLQGSIKRRHVVPERGQRQWRRHHLDAVGRQRRDDLRPARSVGPGAVDQDDAHTIRLHGQLPSEPGRDRAVAALQVAAAKPVIASSRLTLLTGSALETHRAAAIVPAGVGFCVGPGVGFAACFRTGGRTASISP